jgi:5-methylcytosine-specific restriction endonuclease McrA
VKRWNDFYPAKGNTAGVHNWCRECFKAAVDIRRRSDLDRANRYSATSYQRFKEERQAAHKAWSESNPDARAHHSLLRRTRKIQADDGTVTKDVIAAMRRMPCAECGTTELIEIDHITPLAAGGLHSITNIQPLCRFHNRSKGAKTEGKARG